MDNLALQVINEALEREERDELQGFQIDTDSKAEWGIRKIQEEKAELRRMQLLCENMISHYSAKLKEAEDKFEKETAFFKGQLENYFRKLQADGQVKSTKTTESYILPSGTLKLKKQQPEYERDEEKLVAWCKKNGSGNFVKVEESVNWADLKKTLNFKNGQAISDTGEIIQAIKVIAREPKFEIEF